MKKRENCTQTKTRRQERYSIEHRIKCVCVCFAPLRYVTGFTKTRATFSLASSSHWFIVLFASVVIGQSNYFGLTLRHSIASHSNTHTLNVL